MERYIEFIYDDVTALYADDTALDQGPDRIPSANEFANIIDSFACSSLLSAKAFVLYLGWEKQTTKWTTGALRNLSRGLSNGFVVGNTIRREMGHRVDVYSAEHILNLFDTDEVMATKLFGHAPEGSDANLFFTDLTTVKNICIGPARLDMEEWDYSSLQAAMNRVNLQAKFGQYQYILRPHYEGLTEILKNFVNSRSPLNGLNESVGGEVCARCAAYSSMRRLRDGGKKL